MLSFLYISLFGSDSNGKGSEKRKENYFAFHRVREAKLLLPKKTRQAIREEFPWNMLKNNMYFVYILTCRDGSLYTGITTDVNRRFAEHKDGKGGHYTSSHGVVRVAYTEQHPNKSLALKREAKIKSWHRKEKLALVGGYSV